MKARSLRRSSEQAPVQRRGVETGPRRHPERPPVGASLDNGSLLRYQTLAGNQAVGELLGRGGVNVQLQAAACPAPPAPAAPVAPHDDPRFLAVAATVKREAAGQKRHPPAREKVAEAQGAAAPPGNDVASQAAAAQVDTLSQKKPKGFDRAGFIAAVHAAIEKATPKTMDEVDSFATSGKAGEIKRQVAGQVAGSKDAAAGDIKDANAAPPDTSKATPKQVTPMSPEHPGAPPGGVGAGAAAPSPVPVEQVSLEHGKCETDQRLAEHGITEQTVAKSNEPQFQEAMAAKKESDAHATQAPRRFREQERQRIGQASGAAGATATAGLDKMHADRTAVLAHVGGHKDSAKGKDEAARSRVATRIEGIYNATRTEVDETLKGLDGKVTAKFDEGEKAAKDAFENHYKTQKDAYFDKRYSGIEGAARWVADRFSYPSRDVNEFIDAAKKLYLERMGQVIDDVATIVETELTRATGRVQEGRKQIEDYVASQPKELRQVAQEAAANVQSKFDELDQAVSEKSSSVIDDLAQKYVAAAQAIDERCNAMREENKGLLDQAKDKIGGMVETYQKMKAMLAQLAAKAAGVVDQILSDPIGFLGNLIGAVKMGLDQFVGRIGEHLKQGLMGWLLGELADAGITMPESFDLKGILQLVLQVLGLTWTNIRARAVAILGEPVVAMIEQGAEIFQKVVHIFQTLREQGLAGLWEMIQDKIGDLKAQVLDQIQDFIITKVITAGVTWIISLLNPASAFVKACKAIYDIVMFFVERGSQIVALVNAVLDNLAAIASGNLSAAAGLVEQALAKALPIAISFLASLLGVGGISDFIKKTIDTVRAPVFKAVDWVLKTVVAPVARVAAKAVGWVKGKIKSGVDWLKKKGKAGLDKLKSKLGKKDERSPAERKAALDAAMGKAQSVLQEPKLSVDQVRKKLPSIKSAERVRKLVLVVDSTSGGQQHVHIEGANSPTVSGPVVAKPQPLAQRAGEAGGVTAKGGEIDKAAWTEKDIDPLVAGARALQGRATSYLEKVPPEEVERKTVACAGSIVTKSGWGSWGGEEATEKESHDIWARQKLGTFTDLFEQGKKDTRPLEHRLPAPEEAADPAIRYGPLPRPEPGGEYRTRRAGRADWGIPGAYYSSHAERQAYTMTGSASIGVSREMCSECQNFFSSEAKSKQKILVVADPKMARVFLPDGTMTSR
jgi:hypothetical protein